MVAAGCAAHSDHGRTVAEVFLSVASKETEDYKIKDYNKLLAIAPHFGVDVKVEVDGEEVDRDLDEIAIEVAKKALAEAHGNYGVPAYMNQEQCESLLSNLFTG